MDQPARRAKMGDIDGHGEPSGAGALIAAALIYFCCPPAKNSSRRNGGSRTSLLRHRTSCSGSDSGSNTLADPRLRSCSAPAPAPELPVWGAAASVASKRAIRACANRCWATVARCLPSRPPLKNDCFVRSAEGFGDDEMEAYLERMVEEGVLMMVRDKLFFV